MMRFLAWLIVCSIFIMLFPSVGQSMETPSTSAQHAVLMDEETGQLLYEKAAHEKKPIASITKVMTAIVAIQYGNLNETVTVGKEAIHTTGSSIYLEKNEKMSLQDLLYGLMLRSGNDAAVAIAEHVGGSEEGFVYLMNETAAFLGMTNTHFTNPHGLDEAGHYSTAYDMAILMQYANQNKTFQKISGTELYRSKKRTYAWYNKNKLLTTLYEPCTGGKTGYTSKAGRTLVTSAQKQHRHLIAVTLNAPDDWNDHTALYEWGFKRKQVKEKQTLSTRLIKHSPFIQEMKKQLAAILRVGLHG